MEKKLRETKVRHLTQEEAAEATRQHLREQSDFLARGGSREQHRLRAVEFSRWLNESCITKEELDNP